MIGPLNSQPYETEKASLNRANVVSPPNIDNMAAVLLLCLNAGNNPKIMGTDIGPSKAENHVMISPITPPNELAFQAITIVIIININVVTRAKVNDLDCE